MKSDQNIKLASTRKNGRGSILDSLLLTQSSQADIQSSRSSRSSRGATVRDIYSSDTESDGDLPSLSQIRNAVREGRKADGTDADGGGSRGRQEKRIFPVNRIRFRFYAKGWKGDLASVRCVGQGGVMQAAFSKKEVDLGKLPKGAIGQREIVVSNKGDVPLKLGLSAHNTDDLKHSHTNTMGTITLTPPAIPFVVLPGSEARVKVTIKCGRKGPLSFPFRVHLLGTLKPKYWLLRAVGTGDDIQLSVAMASYLSSESLSYLSSDSLAVSDNSHLNKVLTRVDYVPTVSIHHEIAVVRPVMRMPALGTMLALPSPLATDVLHTFKKWYYARVPLRLTEQEDRWKSLEAMLKGKTTVVAGLKQKPKGRKGLQIVRSKK